MAAAISSQSALHDAVDLSAQSIASDDQKARPESALDFLISNKPAQEKTDLLADDMKQAMKALQSAGEQTSFKNNALDDQTEENERIIKDESAVTLIGFTIVIAAIFVVLNLITLVI